MNCSPCSVVFECYIVDQYKLAKLCSMICIMLVIDNNNNKIMVTSVVPK